ncbi:MAG: RluA family pseudouridine synthase [Clostridia bacterium]|nr:RluA family pseudouridine synthase [Clostridia bacterium]MBR6654173.1 RluA family pseudouridine synthase [Oscillospiraceae bacterium]
MNLLIKATLEDAGARLDSFLARSIENTSRSAAQQLIDDGRVTLRGKAVKSSYKVAEDDEFSVELPEVVEDAGLEAQDIPLDVIYEDSDLIVVNKPKGLVVHPAPGHANGTLVNALMYHCGDSLSGVGGELRPGIVHRIDMETSGLLIAAKNDFAHRHLSDQLKDRSLSRVYETIVRGNIKDESGTIDAPIGRHPTDRKRMAVTQRNSRNAVTHYEVIARYDGYTHLRCRLETGRTHQIRVHLAHIGHPVLGDMVYGMKKPELGLDSQCLHARRIKFIHPRTEEHVELESDLPEYFTAVLEKLKAKSGY